MPILLTEKRSFCYSIVNGSGIDGTIFVDLCRTEDEEFSIRIKEDRIMEEQRNNTQSMAMLISSMLIFGTIGIFRRFIPLSSGMLAFVRGLLGGAFLLLFLRIRGYKNTVSMGRKKGFLLILSGMLIGINWILLFEAYNYTTVATATLCYYMEPTIVILASSLIFREKLTMKKIICAVIAILGMVLVSGFVPGHMTGMGGSGDARGVLFGLGAALLYSSVVLLNKGVGSVDPYQRTVIQLFSAALVLLPYLLITEEAGLTNLTIRSVFLVIVVGILHTGIAYALYFGSIEGLKAQSIAIFSYIDPVSAMILSALILHESMTAAGMTGAVMILGAAMVSESG